MSNSRTRERSLRQLLKDNFDVARYCRKVAEVLTDVSLKYYFQNIASRRSQFAMELAEEISYYGGKEPFKTSYSFERSRTEQGQDVKLDAIKKGIGITKESLQLYQEALCQIHDGSCREVLLRHKAFIENCLFELKSIRTLLKFNPQTTEDFKEIINHS